MPKTIRCRKSPCCRRHDSDSPGRKMGHVTFLAEKPDEAWESAAMLRRLLG
nr:hypothetical protein [Nitrospirota bacterium]